MFTIRVRGRSPAPPRRAATAPRRRPVQARSTQLVADILEAAVRVLERDGAQRFTTTRVAGAAGVSIGSLYQYFPNKLAILHRLQLEEWERTGEMIDTILADQAVPPGSRLRAMMRAFFASERAEAPLRLALGTAAPSYHGAPESRARRRGSQRIVSAFIKAAAPHAGPGQRRLAVQLVFVTMTSVGKQLSELRLDAAETNRWADEVSEMLAIYLARLRPGRSAWKK
jgi:AcrR family transcriptional regulator